MPVQPHVMTGVALVTGAASGIGRCCALAFASEGCTRLILSDLNLPGLEAVSKELKQIDDKIETCLVKADMSKEDDIEKMVEEGVSKFGAIHYCVNNAGVTSNPRVRTHELPVDAWDRVQNINLRGVWLCERAQIRQMMKQGMDLKMRTGAPGQRGAIVNISSILGRIASGTVGAYGAAKSGVLGLSRTDAIAYGRDGIRVNSVCPGFIKTPLIEEAIKLGSDYASLVASIPMPRYGMPEEIAQAVVFLASEKASYINGEEICVDGGYIHST